MLCKGMSRVCNEDTLSRETVRVVTYPGTENNRLKYNRTLTKLSNTIFVHNKLLIVGYLLLICFQ